MIVVLLVKYWTLSSWDKSPQYFQFLLTVYALSPPISSQAMECHATHRSLVTGHSKTTYFTGGKMRHSFDVV